MRNKVIKAFCKVPMNLQLFAEGGDGAGADGGNGGGSGDGEGAGGEGGAGSDTPPSFDDFHENRRQQAEFDQTCPEGGQYSVTKPRRSGRHWRMISFPKPRSWQR